MSTPDWVRMHRQRFKPDDVLHEYHINTPPIDVFSICAWAGAPVYLQRSLKDGVRLEVNGSQAKIFVPKEETPWRQRFGAAHAFGHLLRQGQNCSCDFLSGPDEKKANTFAVDLLMPLWLMDESAHDARRDVQRLAALYQVSEDAIRVRLQKLLGID